MWDAKNIQIKGVLAGLAFGFIASVLLSITVAVSFMALSDATITNEIEFQKEFEQSFIVRVIFLVGGLVTAFLVGLVSEWIAKVSTLINATISGAVLFLFNSSMVYLMPDAAPLWSQIIIILGVLPLSIFGGYIYGRTNKT